MSLNFAENIKKLRKSKEITQEKLAEVLSVTGQTVSRWELGICYPDLELLPSIANFFGVSIDMLLSNDASAKEKDSEVFYEKLNAIPFAEREQRIKFVQEYCRKYPDNDEYAFGLLREIKDQVLLEKETAETYMPTILKTAQRLLETKYHYETIEMMAVVCGDTELDRWLDMCPRSRFGKRDCLISRAENRSDAYEIYVQNGLGMLEVFLMQLDSRFPDSMGAENKITYQRSIMDIISSFGKDGAIPDGWKLVYAYKQFVLAACLFKEKKMEEGWEQFDAALEKCKYVHSLTDEWLDMGGLLFSNLKKSRDSNYAMDEKGRKHKLFRTCNIADYTMYWIWNLLRNPKWAWFNSVRETDKYQAALTWIEGNEIKPEDLAEVKK